MSVISEPPKNLKPRAFCHLFCSFFCSFFSLFFFLFLFIFILTFLPGLAWAQQPQPQSIKALKVERGPVLDGSLTDDAWKQAIPFTAFRMVFPREGEPSEITELRVVFDEANLYLGIFCSDSQPAPGPIQRECLSGQGRLFPIAANRPDELFSIRRYFQGTGHQRPFPLGAFPRERHLPRLQQELAAELGPDEPLPAASGKQCLQDSAFNPPVKIGKKRDTL